jgi:hypothetical protein
MLVYIGIAADIVEIFESFRETKVCQTSFQVELSNHYFKKRLCWSQR